MIPWRLRIASGLAVLLCLFVCRLGFAAQGGQTPSADVLPVDEVHADLDGDGRLDIARAGTGTDSVLELILTRPGQLVQFRVAAPLRALIATDLDRDGDLDLVGLERDGSLAFWINQGLGTFAPKPPPPSPAAPRVPSDNLGGLQQAQVDLLARARLDASCLAASRDSATGLTHVGSRRRRTAPAQRPLLLASIVSRGPPPALPTRQLSR